MRKHRSFLCVSIVDRMQAGYYDATVAATTLNSVQLKQARSDRACTVCLNSCAMIKRVMAKMYTDCVDFDVSIA